MTETTEFIEDFLEHKYDPVKAHEYYMRVRKLKGRAGVAKDAKAKEYETRVVSDAQKKLDADLKKTPKIKAKRRISKAEQKLIRARSLIMRIKDPTIKADRMKRLVAAEKKLKALQKKQGIRPKAPVSKPKTAPSGKPKRETITYDNGATVTYEGDKEVATTPPTKKAVSKPVFRRRG